jgi:hypothetical protein
MNFENFIPTTKISISTDPRLWMYDATLKYMIDYNIIPKPIGWDDRFKKGKFKKKD